jgi:hypothetical protein
MVHCSRDKVSDWYREVRLFEAADPFQGTDS